MDNFEQLNYNKERYLELLTNESESLSSDEKKELSRYSNLLHDQINWETQYHYLQFLKKFLENKINILELWNLVQERDLLNSEVVEFLESKSIVLLPHKKSIDFSILVYEIMDICEGYGSEVEFVTITDEKIKNCKNHVEVIYMKFQELLKE